MRSLREILHQLLYNLPIRRNYAGKSLLDKKNFSQSTLRRKDIKEYKVYKKKILKRFASPKNTLRLCALCVRFITLKLFAL